MVAFHASSAIPFAILRELAPGAAARWQAAHPGWTIAAWGPLWLGLPAETADHAVRQSGDGRATGVVDGVVWNDLQVRERWRVRGQQLQSDDHRQLAIEELAAHGPRGLGELRWHGAAAVLHRAQGAALLARDPLGIGWLGYAATAELQVFSSDPRLDGQAVPPGVALRVEAKGWLAQPIRSAAENLPYFREIPDELRGDDGRVLGEGLRVRLQAAVAAARRGVGELVQTPADAGLRRWAGAAEGAKAGSTTGLWSPQGWPSLAAREWPEPEPWPRPGAWPAVEPPEPVISADAVDRNARIWRATALVDRDLRQARAQALDQGRFLVLPHLDPAVLAWLGAIGRVRRIEILGAT
ncbi:MAG: hypothetical protein HY902_07130 [Deltaproteobacteria bacterium]|nr:hypothetical protein [Deltaproteobacteria bacterium]